VIPYGKDYPDAPWVDRDREPIDDSEVSSVLETSHSGQLRMACRLAESFRDRLLFVHGIGWHHYDGARWAYDDIGAAKRAVIDVLGVALADSLDDKQLRADVRKCESASGVAGVLDIAAALAPFAATVRDLDADPYLLNVANGTLNLRTMELVGHSPADRLTKVTTGAYHVDTKPGDWHRFLTTVLPDESVRGYVQRHAGVALLGKVVEHVLSIWTGTGANGKGTAIGALCWALGDYACTAEPDLFMHREGAHPTGEMDLMGRRLAVVTETDEGRRFAEATMKRCHKATGGPLARAPGAAAVKHDEHPSQAMAQTPRPRCPRGAQLLVATGRLHHGQAPPPTMSSRGHTGLTCAWSARICVVRARTATCAAATRPWLT
jgi:putative DNA primase/helicase